MERLLPLDASETRDSSIAGGKAARLARARATGLPVPRGWVVPAADSRRAVAAGVGALSRSSTAAARLAVASIPMDDALLSELERRARQLGGRVVVRSSFPGECDARWAGAFSTYVDVGPEDMAAAVRGCWASLFSRDVDGRRAELGPSASELRMAVLVQPLVELRSGGLARIASDGRITVSSVSGSPAALMAGTKTGTVVELDRDYSAMPREGDDGDADECRSVGMLAHAVWEATGDDTIEWGSTASGEIVLLQASSATAAFPTPRRGPSIGPVTPGVARVARRAGRFPGPLGEELIMAWALSPGRFPHVRSITVAAPAAALTEARALAFRLASYAWSMRADAATAAAREAFAALKGVDPVVRADALRRVDDLRPLDPDRAGRVVGLVAGVADHLVTSGLLASPELVWRVPFDALLRAVERGNRPLPIGGPDRWEPFLFEVVRGAGTRLLGTAVAPGAGAGPVRMIGRGWLASPPAPRQILYAPSPVPHLAPLLWGCAGLVTGMGGVGAHLFEVARSLGVPVVAGVHIPAPPPDGSMIAAIDGDVGTVAVLADDEVTASAAG